jgi:hypothetical protein
LIYFEIVCWLSLGDLGFVVVVADVVLLLGMSILKGHRGEGGRFEKKNNYWNEIGEI